jgi:glucose-1-phosphate thymidylyltransferase
VRYAESLKPSARGEIEITDLNKIYLENEKLKVKLFSRGVAWLDLGTHESLLQGAMFIEAIQQRQGLMIACLEEIAYRAGFISKEQLETLGKVFAGNSYGKYILEIARNG